MVAALLTRTHACTHTHTRTRAHTHTHTHTQQCTYDCILVIELDHNRRWGLQNALRVPKQSDLLDDQSLVPRGANTLLHHARPDAATAKRHDGIGI